jgi:hypothetical protein
MFLPIKESIHMIEYIKGAIKNRQSTDTGSIGHTRHTKKPQHNTEN